MDRISNMIRTHGWNQKMDMFNEKHSWIVGYISYVFFTTWMVEQIQDNKAIWTAIKWRGCNNSCMNSKYGRIWIINKPSTIEDEACRVDANYAHTIGMEY